MRGDRIQRGEIEARSFGPRKKNALVHFGGLLAGSSFEYLSVTSETGDTKAEEEEERALPNYAREFLTRAGVTRSSPGQVRMLTTPPAATWAA